MKKRVLIGVGLLAFVIAAVAMVPARLVEGAINKRVGNQATLRVESGTIWSGRGVITLSERLTRSKPAALRLNWSFAPSTLLRLRAGFDVTVDGEALAGSARIAPGLGDVEVSRASLRAPIASWRQLHGALMFARADGTLQLDSPADRALTIRYPQANAALRMNGGMNMVIRDLRLRNLGSDVLGTHGAELKFFGERVEYVIQQSRGIVSLSGGGEATLGTPARALTRANFNGSVRPVATLPAWLEVGLRSMGRAAADGGVNVRFDLAL
jgi:hypothetical protein